MKHIKLFESINIKDVNDIKLSLKELLYDITDNESYLINIKHYKKDGLYKITINISCVDPDENLNLYKYLNVFNRMEKYLNINKFNFSNVLLDEGFGPYSILKNKLSKENNFKLKMRDLTAKDLEFLYSITFSFSENIDIDMNDKLNISRVTWLGSRGSILGWDRWVNKNKELFT